MKCIGAWYPDKVRNSVFGIFGTCAFAGGVIGTAIAVSTDQKQDRHCKQGYRGSLMSCLLGSAVLKRVKKSVTSDELNNTF